jgi:hypothetical protein
MFVQMVKNGHDTHIDDDPEEKGPHDEGGRWGVCGWEDE